MKTLILFTPNKLSATSTAKVVRIVDTPAEAKAIFKDQSALAEILKENPEGGTFLIVPPNQQRPVVPVTQFVVTDAKEE